MTSLVRVSRCVVIVLIGGPAEWPIASAGFAATLVSFDFLSICFLQAVFSLSSAAVSISKAMGGISKS